MFELGLMAAALATALSAGIYTHLRNRVLGRAIGEAFDLRAEGGFVAGTIDGHAIRVSCGKVTRFVVRPGYHDARDVQFRLRSQSLIDQFELGARRPKTGDEVLEQRFVFEGEDLRIATVATAAIRKKLTLLARGWSGSSIEWNGTVLSAHDESRDEEQLKDTLEAMLQVAEAFGDVAESRLQQLRRNALYDPNAYVRAHVLHLIAVRVPQLKADVLGRALNDPATAVRFLAMFHLPFGAYPVPNESTLVRVATHQGPENGRRAAIHLLRRHGTLEAVGALNGLKTEGVFRKDVENTIAELHEKFGTGEGRVSLVDGDAGVGQVSEVPGRGQLGLVDD